MAAEKRLRSTIVYAFAATTPAPPRLPNLPNDSLPDIEVDETEERITLTPIGDGPNEVSKTFASIPPPPAFSLLPEEGDVVGEHYQLVRKLGEGTFGRVYVAQRIDVPEHQVALKILPRSLYVGRNVERELVMLATVGHPHVVQLKDHGTTEDYVWLTMPVYEGETLHERLQRGSLSLREAYDIFRTVAYGLEALHDAGLRHQDIKPDNIYLAVFGRRIHPVLLDLGVAAEKEASFIAGTALYASPEQIFALDASPNKAPLTEKMDTYCFATTLLMALVGPKYFPGETATQPAELAIAHAQRASEPIAKEALPELVGEPRAKLQAALSKWMALEPKDRPSMAEVAEQLDVLLEREREEKRREEAHKERQKATLLRFRIGLGALALGAIATAVVVYNQRETLRMANALAEAQSKGAESFDSLNACSASHKIASKEAASCKAARAADQADFQRSLEELSKKGADADKLQEMRVLVGSYSGKLKLCEDGAQAAAKSCIEDTARLIAIAEKEKGDIAAARDEQKKLVEARDKEIAALKQSGQECSAERATCLEQKSQCIDQKAQILIACANTPSKSGGGTAPAGTGAAAGTATGAPSTQAPTAPTAPSPPPVPVTAPAPAPTAP